MPGTAEPVIGSPAPKRADAVRSFPPLEGDRAELLILGSMPGIASLEASRYYAHPRNAFWPIVTALLDEVVASASRPVGTDPHDAVPHVRLPSRTAELPSYECRARRLLDGGIALWDVLAECERPGSLDAAIRRDSERANDIPALCARHPELRLVAFNGQTAAKLFARHVGTALRAARPDLAYATLPSTSPAYASSTLADKLARWRTALAPVLAHGARSRTVR